MEIAKGINPNCSELVEQVCGVTKDIAEEMKLRFKELLNFKYSKDYLEDYASGTFNIQGKYCLDLYYYEGCEYPDWHIIKLIAEEMKLPIECVDCCSNPIDSDDQMEEQLKIKKEREEKK